MVPLKVHKGRDPPVPDQLPLAALARHVRAQHKACSGHGCLITVAGLMVFQMRETPASFSLIPRPGVSRTMLQRPQQPPSSLLPSLIEVDGCGASGFQKPPAPAPDGQDSCLSLPRCPRESILFSPSTRQLGQPWEHQKAAGRALGAPPEGPGPGPQGQTTWPCTGRGFDPESWGAGLLLSRHPSDKPQCALWPPGGCPSLGFE